MVKGLEAAPEKPPGKKQQQVYMTFLKSLVSMAACPHFSQVTSECVSASALRVQEDSLSVPKILFFLETYI